MLRYGGATGYINPTWYLRSYDHYLPRGVPTHYKSATKLTGQSIVGHARGLYAPAT